MEILMTLFFVLQAVLSSGQQDHSNLGKLIQTAQQISHQQSPGHVVDPTQPDKEVATPEEPSRPQRTDPQKDTAPVIKGIYVTAHSAGGARMATLLDLIDRTELNAMVIDLKDDYGYITYPTDNPQILQMGTAKSIIKDMDGLMQRLQEHEVYPIARIVVFKDSILARQNMELSFLNPDGSVWHNGTASKIGDSFVNPYMQEVWAYNVEVAKEAAKFGFKEIQFDYVRFPEGFEKRAETLTYTRTEESRVEAVTGFVEYARQELEPLGVRVSVDIFGYAASVPAAEGIGQDFVQISDSVHVISPMIYPSHYSTGWFKQKDPDKAPYEIIKGAMNDTHKKLEELGDTQPIIRPWIQDFTASWLGPGHYIKYGAAEVSAQVQALKDSGVDEFLLWNAGNKYSDGAKY